MPELQLVSDQIISDDFYFVTWDSSGYGEIEREEFCSLKGAIDFIEENALSNDYQDFELFRKIPFEISATVKVL